MDIIPAIDIIDGKCVRLSEGNYSSKKIYSNSPVDVAIGFQKIGIKKLHLVDLDGAKARKVINIDVLKNITTATDLEVDFGGGVQSTEDLAKVFKAGAQKVTGGSIAVRNPDLFEHWLTEFGPEKIILGADVKHGKVAISGWQEQSEWALNDYLLHYIEKGITQVICTDVSKDGLLQSPVVDLYERLAQSFPRLSIIASGGVSSMADLHHLRLTGVTGAIVGKAIYEQRITLKQLAEF